MNARCAVKAQWVYYFITAILALNRLLWVSESFYMKDEGVFFSLFPNRYICAKNGSRVAEASVKEGQQLDSTTSRLF